MKLVVAFDYIQALRYCELAQYKCQPQSIMLAFVHEKFGDIFNQMGGYNEAISHSQTSIDIQLQLPNKTNICLAKSYRNIGIIYGCMGEMNEALQYFRQGLDLQPENLFLMLDLHQGTADACLDLKQFDKVLEHLDQMTTLCDKIVSDKDIYIAGRLYTTGRFYLKKGNANVALKNLTEALRIYLKELPEFHPKVCDTYLAIGLTLEKLNKTDEALQIFEKVKTISLVIYPKNHPVIAACYHRVSIILRNKNLLQESLNNARNALAAALITQPINYRELSRIYDTLSSIYIKTTNFVQARMEVQKGSTVRQNHCFNDLPLSQINLANIYIHEHCTQEAINILNQITDDQLLLVDNYTPARLSKDIATIYNNLQQYEAALRMADFSLQYISDDEHYLGAETHFLAAQISWTLGHQSQTLEHLNHALIMLDDTTNEGYQEMIIHILKNMAKIYKSLNKYLQAVECYQKIISLCKTDGLAQIHLDIGICYAELDEMKLSLESYQSALTLCSSIEYLLLANIHDELGKYYTRMGNKTEALKYFENTLDMRLRYMKSDDSRLDLLYGDIGQLYLETEKYQEAAKVFEQLVERQMGHDDHENAVNTFVLLGIIQVSQENISKAIHYYELGLQLCLSMPSPCYKTAAYIYSHMAEAYDSDYNVWKCAESYEKAVEMALIIEPRDDELLTLFQENVQVARQNVTKIESRLVELESTTTTTTTVEPAE